MAGVRGSLSWGFQPLDYSGSNLFDSFPAFGQRANHLMGVHQPIRYQIQWTGLHESENASIDNFDNNNGDLIKVVFEVKSAVDAGTGSPTYETIATIKKTKDIANRNYATGASNVIQRFTIDISQLLADELSYSLCPIDKGTWESNYYGGMNGGAVMQDNVLGNSGVSGSPVSWFNISKNGTYRNIKVVASFEVINGEGHVVTAATAPLNSEPITVINSVSQFEQDETFIFDYVMYNTYHSQKFLTRNPYEGADIKKPVRIDEEAEFLQFYIYSALYTDISGAGDNSVGAIGLKVETFDASGAENTFYMRDFEANAETQASTGFGTLKIKDLQEQMFIQNVSPYYIKNLATGTSDINPATAYAPPDGSNAYFPYWESYSGTTITDDTIYYRVSFIRIGLESTYTIQKGSEYKYYVIDREDENIPYGFVRFHWLNSMGGIDSYTAKRDVSEGLTISRDVVERKSVDRTWYQTDYGNNDLRISDTMRGGDLYKGGREVSNVNAERNLSVYTEPLNTMTAKWLEEIMLSPNVWVEMDTPATARGNEREPYLRPSTKGYIPVIITNSDVETVNQEQGLVKFNIDYTLAHKVITQRT
tara:strand:+ start:1049 stop:2824 length:1776 start_codon:yes stop_codon:yes gene_type:complete